MPWWLEDACLVKYISHLMANVEPTVALALEHQPYLAAARGSNPAADKHVTKYDMCLVKC